MNKILSLFFSSTVVATSLSAQICATSEIDRFQNQFQARLSAIGGTTLSISNPNTPNINVRVIFHIYNNIISSAGTDVMINTLNATFNPFKISFYKYCDNFIPVGGSRGFDIAQPYAINIYILDGFFTPYAGGIGATTLFLPLASVNTSTLPHEVGHCLYLFHTHNERGCLEKPDGSNCTTCGDYVCDTPADPTLYKIRYWVDNETNCSYNGTFTLDGQPYNPDTRNIMSYSRLNCRNRFTVGQGQRMYDALGTLDVLIPTTKPLQIQGPSPVCTNANFSFGTSAVSTISWSSSNPSGLTINPTTGAATRINNFNGQVTITATINGGACGNVSVPRTVVVGTGVADPLFEQKTIVCPTGSYFYSILGRVTQSLDPNASYKWYIGKANRTNFVLKTTSSSNSATVPGDVVDNLFYTFRVDITNICGTVITAYQEGRFKASCSGGGGGTFAKIFPNPASNQLTIGLSSSQPSQSNINIETNEGSDIDLTADFEARLYDSFQQRVRSASSQNGVVNFNVADLPNGIYYLHLINGGQIIRKQIMVSK
jgi:hypothetical protein